MRLNMLIILSPLFSELVARVALDLVFLGKKKKATMFLVDLFLPGRSYQGLLCSAESSFSFHTVSLCS